MKDKNRNLCRPVRNRGINFTRFRTIFATISVSPKTGNGYLIRVVASDPAVTGSSSPNTIKINPKPSGVNTTGITPCQATLNWTGVATANSYQVQYKETSSSTWSATITAGAVSSYTFSGLN